MIRMTKCRRGMLSRIVAMFVLVVVLACPLAELFDHWDHTLETGNDTEYAVVVLALCVGTAYLFARFIFNSELLVFLAKSFLLSLADKSFLAASCRSALLRSDNTSPPPLPLRI